MRIGMLTSGGDCQCLNATMEAIAKVLYKKNKDIEIYGILDGFAGLINGKYKKMEKADFDNILLSGGTILGTSRQPFKTITKPDENGRDKVEMMIKNYEKWKLDALIVLGGNGSHKTANLLSEKGLNVVTAPKTIDNDIWGTDVTFGFDSAVKVATETMDNIKTTASSHGRIFVVEVMGHKTGWVTLYSGIATGADIILIPEIPYDINKITSYIEKSDKKYLVIAAAEGIVEKEFSSLKNKERRQLLREKNLKSQVEKLAFDIQSVTDKEVRITIPGHTQRGGSPTARDRIVSMQTGTATALNIINKNYGVMAAVINGKIVNVPLKEVAGKLKVVPADAEIILQAKEMGICFGD